MNQRQSIHLSFFPLTSQVFRFAVYRKHYVDGETKHDRPGYSMYKLPTESCGEMLDTVYKQFWVGFDRSTGFERFECQPFDNNYLTRHYLYTLLRKRCQVALAQDRFELDLPNFTRKRRIYFVLKEYDEGRQTVWLEPYLLKATHEFGFLVDFAFLSRSSMPPTARSLELSLSLDRNGHRNRNFYADRYDMVQRFTSEFSDPVSLLTDDLSFTSTFASLSANTLDSKVYVFADGATSNSQFRGVRDKGPIRSIDSKKKMYFIFREQDRSYANALFRALRGDTFPHRFPGMEAMFGFSFDRRNVDGKSIKHFNYREVEAAISEIGANAEGREPVLLLISPFDRFSKPPADRETYARIKHHCLVENLPCQLVSTTLMNKKRQFEWAVSGIGLQLFVKMGGWPWKLQHRTGKCLIIGVSQAHDRDTERIKRYLAYSTFTDSSGIYHELKVLSDTDNGEEHISMLKTNLERAIRMYYSSFDTFVLHTSFAIKRHELDAIKDVIALLDEEDSQEKSFIVMKFNDANRFFAYASGNNSMIPYESTFVELSSREMLIWFEGLQYHSSRIPASIDRPVHIEFMYPDEPLERSSKVNYLQDAMNISGANWRGFNAKSLPISIFYASLVARYYRDCQRFGLMQRDLEAVTPWFL